MPRSAVAVPRQLVRDFGTCLDFNGSSAFASTTAVVTTKTTDFSVSAWINPAVLPQLGFVMFNTVNAAGWGFCIASAADTSGTKLTILSEAVAWDVTSYTFPRSGIWYHIAITRTGTTYTVYVNGVQVDTKVRTQSTPANGFLIGQRQGGTQRFRGKIDDVRYWDRVLTPTEVSNLYYGIEPVTTSLVGWWKMDEGSGSTLTDSSGGGKDLTITAATYSTDVFMTLRQAA